MDKKILGGIVTGIIIIIGIVLSMGFSDDSEPTIEPTNKIGLVVNPSDSAVTLEKLDQIYSHAKSSGIGRSNVYLFWNIIEPQKNQFDWKQSDVLMSMNKKNNLSVTLYFSVINGKTLGPFPTWIGKPPIQSIPEDRLVAVLDAILSRYDIIDTVIIAGQTESQFRYSKHNIPSYKEIFNYVYAELKQKHPNVKIGNSFALHNIINKNLEDIVEQLAIGDFVAFSYMPVDSLNDIIKTPDDAKRDLEQISKLIPEKKYGLFEISWSTSDFVGGSEDSQDEFLQKTFEFFSENESDIEFLTWYRMYDKPVGTCVTEITSLAESKISVGGGSSLGSSEYVIERLDHYICNAGLINVNEKPKPAWDEFIKQINNLY